MSSELSLVLKSISVLQKGVTHWSHSKEKNDSDAKAKRDAIQKVMLAAIATKAYLYDKRVLGDTSRDKEHELSTSWQDAAMAIAKYDKNLFESSRVKSLGWADPREWIHAEHKAVTVDLETIIKQCDWLLNN